MSGQPVEVGVGPDAGAANALAWLAFVDILIFFGVLLVGFAYLWKRGDLEWIRSTAGQKEPEPVPAEGGG
jgi:NADH-quinone oxidoreductase subunit A